MPAPTSLRELVAELSFFSDVRSPVTVGISDGNKSTDERIAAVYGYYVASGTKQRMDQLRQVSETFTNVKDKAVQATPSPKAAIGFLKSVANSYASESLRLSLETGCIHKPDLCRVGTKASSPEAHTS